MPQILGCPTQYDIRFHWRGGRSVYAAPVDGVTSLVWGRRLDEISQASVVVGKTGQVPQCCGPLGRLEPWAHELSVYRDTELVWQGPVRRVIERRTEWEVQAADVVAWLDKRMQRIDYSPTDNELSFMAENLIRTAVGVDDEVISAYLRVTPTTITGDLDVKGGTKKCWEIIQQDLLPQGLDLTTVGRSIVIGPEADASTPAQARLSDADLGGDIEVEVNGVDAVTHQWVHGGPEFRGPGEPNGPDVIVDVGGYTPTWDRLEELVTNPAWNTTVQARAIASTLLRQLRPPLVVVRVPAGAQLSALAPVTMAQLVPGERVDVVTSGMCRPVAQGFRLAQIQVTWGGAAGAGAGGGETVQVSLVPLRGEEIPPTQQQDREVV